MKKLKTSRVPLNVLAADGPEVTTTLLGVKWDRPLITVLNAILMDVMSYRRILKPGQRLVIACEDAGFIKRACDALGIGVSEDPQDLKKCEIWKLYYVEQCPEIPSGNVVVYEKQVDSAEVKRLVMRPGDPRYPSLFNPQDNRMVPPGKSPNINKIPPRYYHSYPNVLYSY